MKKIFLLVALSCLMLTGYASDKHTQGILDANEVVEAAININFHINEGVLYASLSSTMLDPITFAITLEEGPTHTGRDITFTLVSGASGTVQVDTSTGVVGFLVWSPTSPYTVSDNTYTFNTMG